jgi:predicted signal transduction protein with EAL and GGDEF domain
MDNVLNTGDPSRAGKPLAGPVVRAAGMASGWEAFSLLTMMVAQAVTNSAETRKRAAVLRIGFEPARPCIESKGCWDRAIDELQRRIPIRAGEWAPLRIGDTEIVVVLAEFRDSLDALVRANEILAVLVSPCSVDGQDIHFTSAIGIGLFPEDGDGAATLLGRAAEALADLRMMGLSAAGFSLRRVRDADGVRTPRLRRKSMAIVQPRNLIPCTTS